MESNHNYDLFRGFSQGCSRVKGFFQSHLPCQSKSDFGLCRYGAYGCIMYRFGTLAVAAKTSILPSTRCRSGRNRKDLRSSRRDQPNKKTRVICIFQSLNPIESTQSGLRPIAEVLCTFFLMVAFYQFLDPFL